MKIKTSELTDKALDWAVALAEHDELACRVIQFPEQGKFYQKVSPSTNWNQAGPIIERERIDVFSVANGKGWCAQSDVRVFNGYGSSPLVAAMRCYVASKLGDEVDIPEDLA